MNPIMQILNRNSGRQVNDVMQLLQGNPQQMLNNMLSSNPQFQKFVNENKDLSPQQICQKFGVDPSILNMLK